MESASVHDDGVVRGLDGDAECTKHRHGGKDIVAEAATIDVRNASSEGCENDRTMREALVRGQECGPREGRALGLHDVVDHSLELLCGRIEGAPRMRRAIDDASSMDCRAFSLGSQAVR